MPLGMEVGLSPGDFVLDGDPVPLPQKGQSLTQFSAHVYCVQTAAWITMPLGTEVGRPTRHCVQCGPSYTQKKMHTHPTQFLAHVYCGQTAGWMTTPLSTEVDLGPGHIVLDGAAVHSSPLFSAHVYYGHSRPS